MHQESERAQISKRIGGFENSVQVMDERLNRFASRIGRVQTRLAWRAGYERSESESMMMVHIRVVTSFRNQRRGNVTGFEAEDSFP